MARKPIGKHTGRLDRAAMRRLQAEELKLSGTTTLQSGPMPAVLVEARLLDAEMAALKKYATYVKAAIDDGSYSADEAMSPEDNAHYLTSLSKVNELVDDWRYSEVEDRNKLLRTAESVVWQQLSLGEGEGSRLIAANIALKQAMIRECRTNITNLCRMVGYEWSLDDFVEAAKDQVREEINRVSKTHAQETDTANDSKTWKEEFADLVTKHQAQRDAALEARTQHPNNKRVGEIADWMEKVHPLLSNLLDIVRKEVADHYVREGGDPKRRLHEWIGKAEPNAQAKVIMDGMAGHVRHTIIKTLGQFDAFSDQIVQESAKAKRGGLLSRVFGRGESQAAR